MDGSAALRLERIEAGDVSSTHEPEWHERRRTGLGGSDIWPLLSGDALRLYHEKTRPYEPDPEENISTDQVRGQLLEPVIGRLWTEKTGRAIRRHPHRRNPDRPWAVVHLDYQVLANDEHPTSLLEIKAPRLRIYDQILDGGLREKTACQIMHGMYVTGYEEGHYAAGNLEATPMIVTFSMERAPIFIELLDDVERRFWEHVETNTPPDPAEFLVLGKKAKTEIRDTTIEKTILLDAELTWEAAQYDSVREIEKNARKEKEEIRDRLMAFLQETEHTEVFAGEWKIGRFQQRRTKLDDAALLGHRPIDRDAFVRWFLRDIENDLEEANRVADELRLELDPFISTKISDVLNVRNVGG